MPMKLFQLIMNYVKLAISMFLIGVMAYAFTNYLDGDIGVVIWSFLIIAPLLSLVFTLLARRKLSVSLDAPDYIDKKKHFAVKVNLRSKGRLPVPFVRFQLLPTANLQPDDPRPVQCAFMSGNPQRMHCQMTALHAGCAAAELGNVQITDYLGLFSFSVKLPPQLQKIGVIPEIPSLTGAGILLRSVSDLIQTQDEEEEESQAVYSSAAMPGYVHREYVPGDHLRRINWKLSAKRDKLMVRMDEAAVTVRPSLILDLPEDGTPEIWKRREILMEGALGFLMLLVQQGIACSIRFASEGKWHCLYLENEEAVRQAAVELATADFRYDGNRLDPNAAMEKAGAYLIYTSYPDAGLSGAMRSLREHGFVCCVTTDDREIPEDADAGWLLSEDFQMTAVQK